MTALSDLILLLDEASDTRQGATLTAEQVALITGNTTLLDDLKAIVEGHLPPTLTITDIAEDLQVSKKTFQRLRASGRFIKPCKSAGTKPRWDRTDYMNWKLGRHAA